MAVDSLEVEESMLIDVWSISGNLIMTGVNKSELKNLDAGIYIVKATSLINILLADPNQQI